MEKKNNETDMKLGTKKRWIILDKENKEQPTGIASGTSSRTTSETSARTASGTATKPKQTIPLTKGVRVDPNIINVDEIPIYAQEVIVGGESAKDPTYKSVKFQIGIPLMSPGATVLATPEITTEVEFIPGEACGMEMCPKHTTNIHRALTPDLSEGQNASMLLQQHPSVISQAPTVAKPPAVSNTPTVSNPPTVLKPQTVPKPPVTPKAPIAIKREAPTSPETPIARGPSMPAEQQGNRSASNAPERRVHRGASTTPRRGTRDTRGISFTPDMNGDRGISLDFPSRRNRESRRAVDPLRLTPRRSTEQPEHRHARLTSRAEEEDRAIIRSQITAVLDKLYRNRERRSSEKHKLVTKILQEQLKEVTAKAALAQLRYTVVSKYLTRKR